MGENGGGAFIVAYLIVTATETSIALLAGLMIFPFVFTYGFDPGAGSQLAFETP